jgi:hypothetical protein
MNTFTSRKKAIMGAIITTLIIVFAIGGRFWFELRQFDRTSAEAAAARARAQGSTAVPLRADYYF